MVGGDVHDRSVEDIEDMPVVDLYTAGFPRQPWSPEGKGEGREDQQGRGRIFDHVAKVIELKSPKSFLLADVAVLRHPETRRSFDKMIDTLK